MLDNSIAQVNDQLLPPSAWLSSTAPVTEMKSDHLPMLDESIALEKACGDLDQMVSFVHTC